MRLDRMGMLALGLAVATAGTVAAQEAEEGERAPTPPLWLVSCSNEMQPDVLLCDVSQSIVITDESGRSQRLATAAFVRAMGSEDTMAILTLPLEMDLTLAPALTVDGDELGTLAWQSCDALGCYASGQASDDWLSALRGGDAFVAHAAARNGQGYDFNFQLEDFLVAEATLP